jgi:hypothetical protein
MLQRLLLIVGIDAEGLTGCVSGRAARPVSESVSAVLEQPLNPGILSSADLEDLVAFAEVLVQGRALGSAERGYVVEHIEDRARQNPEYLALYQTTARTLERLAGRRVSSLDIRERIELATRHRLGDQRALAGEDLGPFAEEVRAVRKRAARDLIDGYYRSPAGWAVVDYATFPGRCGDLTRYTRAES